MIFLNFQDYYKNVAIHDQLNKIENMVVTGIVTVATDEETNSSVMMRIPKTITNEYYEIRFDDGKLNVTLGNGAVDKVSKVFNLDEQLGGRYIFQGRLVSNKGKITIYKNGKYINIL